MVVRVDVRVRVLRFWLALLCTVKGGGGQEDVGKQRMSDVWVRDS